MRRLDGLLAISAVVAAMLACSKQEAARRATGEDCTTWGACGSDGGVPAAPDARPVDGGITRDATAPTPGDGATLPFSGDVVVPPFDRDAAIDNGDASTSIFDVAPPFDALPPTPDSSVVVQPLPDTTVCEHSTVVAFRTDFLEPVAPDAGTGVPPASEALRAAWHNALVSTGEPGPALIVLSRFGLLPDGGTRRFRFGTPDARLVADSATDVIYSFERPAANAQNPANPLDGVFTVARATQASGSLLGAGGTSSVLLGFARANGTRYDIPVVGIALEAHLRSDLAGACTALDVVDLALGIPASALTATLDGQPLSTLLDAPVVPDGGGPALAIVHLTGTAPAVRFEEAP